MDRLLVDADHAIAVILQEPNDLVPAVRIVPVFALRRALHRDAHIRLGDRRAFIRAAQARRCLGRIGAEDIAGGAIQPDMAEVGGLMDALGVVEEQAERVAGASWRPASARRLPDALRSGSRDRRRAAAGSAGRTARTSACNRAPGRSLAHRKTRLGRRPAYRSGTGSSPRGRGRRSRASAPRSRRRCRPAAPPDADADVVALRDRTKAP